MLRKAAPAALWALLALPVAFSVYRQGALEDRTFLWDPSSHALNGLRFYDAVVRVQPIEFVMEIARPHHYPPVHSILQFPFYLVMGRSPDAARLASVAALTALAVLGVFLARRCGADPFCGPLVFLAAVASSPHFLICAGVPMLEIFGGLGFVFFPLCYLRSLERPDDPKRALAAGVAATLVFLTTSNFAMILFTAILLYEVIRGDRRAALRSTRDFFSGYRVFNVWNFLAAASFVCAAVVRVTGGFRLPRFILASPYPPLSCGIAFLAVPFALALWKKRAEIRAWHPRLRGFFWGTLAPIVVWFVIYPPRLRMTIDFMGGGGAGGGKLGPWLAAYPKAWIGGLHLSPFIGVTAVAAVLSSLVFWKRRPEASRFVTVLTLIATAALFAHPMRDLRFWIGVLPLYWILLASEMTRWTGRLWPLRAAIALALAATAWPAWNYHRDDLAARIRGTWYSPPGTAGILRLVGSEAAAVKSVRIMGMFPGLSHHMIEFEIRTHRSLRKFILEGELESPERVRRTTREIYDRWISRRPEARVITLEVQPGFESEYAKSLLARDYARYLEADPRYRAIRDERFEANGLRVRVWEAGPR